MLKQIHKELYPTKQSWHGGIKKYWRSSGAFNVNFDKIPYLFFCWIWGNVPGCIFHRDQSTEKQKLWNMQPQVQIMPY